MGITPTQRMCPGSKASSAGTNMISHDRSQGSWRRGEMILRERNQREPSSQQNTGNRNAPIPKTLQQQVGNNRADYADPIAGGLRAGKHGGAVQRRIERRIGSQREEKSSRGDAQQESDQLIEPPVVRGSENL